jgi:hypothetical protein
VRRALVWAIVAAAASAAAEEATPIVVAPFRNRCFDAADLAQRVRTQLPGSVVLVGTPPAGAHHFVRVSGDERQLTVQLTLRNQRHQVVGSDERQLALADDCTAAAETAALMVVRAATPLAFRPPPRPRKPPSESRPPTSENRPPTSESRPPTSENRPPASENRPAPASENRPAPASENRPAAASENRPTSASEIRPTPAPLSEIRTPPKRRRLEVEVTAMWTFPLDGPPSAPAGDIAVGWRWRVTRRLLLGVGVRVGVVGEWSATGASAEGMVTVSARRIPLEAELRLDVDVPKGVLRVSIGPEAAIWVAGSTGLPRPGSAVFAEPGAAVRAAYRLELGRLVLQAGLALETAFLRDDLTVGGVGRVAQTPLVLLSPFVGAGVGFF